jgi:CHAD domain-containing protein
MSTARDYSVLLQTLKLLEKKHRGGVREKDLKLLRERLSDRKEAEVRSLKGLEGGFEVIAGELDEALIRLDSTLHLRNHFDSIGPGMKRIYRRGRQHLQEMQEERTMETLHEYRKNCRYLQYQMELIQPLFPELLRPYATTLDEHAELLGKIRDFQRFKSYIQHEMMEVISHTGIKHLAHAVSQMEQKITTGVLRNAALIFAEKPRRFTERIQFYWNLQHSIN